MKKLQLRGARALLGWSQEKLAQESGVSLPTIKRLEPGDDPMAARFDTVEKVKHALQNAGIIFIDENREGPGVRLRKDVG